MTRITDRLKKLEQTLRPAQDDGKLKDIEVWGTGENGPELLDAWHREGQRWIHIPPGERKGSDG